jgi:hypothetical protein
MFLFFRFLATGDSFSTIGHSFRMGFSTVSSIVAEVCDVIWQRLQPTYMPQPTAEIWEKAISGFQEKWHFPNCIGSIDGKHVTIKCPNKTGSNHFCYLHKFSIVLLAIVDQIINSVVSMSVHMVKIVMEEFSRCQKWGKGLLVAHLIFHQVDH